MGLQAGAAWLSWQLSPLDAWQRPSVSVRAAVGERGWTSSHPRRTSPRRKSCPVGASSAHRRIRIFETSHYIGFTPMLKVDDIK